jgi:hypothetical protein
MAVLRLDRLIKTKNANLGVIRELNLCTLELPWLDNQRNISCIPAGQYPIRVEGKRIRVLDVPGRDGILIHVANKPSELRGCIAVGFLMNPNAEWVGLSIRGMERLIQAIEEYKFDTLDIWQS